MRRTGRNDFAQVLKSDLAASWISLVSLVCESRVVERVMVSKSPNRTLIEMVLVYRLCLRKRAATSTACLAMIARTSSGLSRSVSKVCSWEIDFAPRSTRTGRSSIPLESR